MSDDIDVKEHAVMLRGYMDAVGRAVTTDEVLYALTVRELDSENTPESILEVPVTQGEAVDRIHQEFIPIVQGKLGLNGNDRLSFYLIDYLSWFKEMYGATSVHRLNCNFPNSESEENILFSAFHRFSCADRWSFMTIITISKKQGGAEFNTPMLFDRPNRSE